MKKKIGLSIVIMFALGIGALVYFAKQHAVVNTSLSARSREYLDKRNQSEDSSLRYVDIDEKGELTNKIHTVGNCFRLKIPFRVGITRFEKACEGYFQILNPNGRVLAYVEKTKGAEEQMSGVNFRRKSPDLYVEETKVIGEREFLIFSKKDEAYDKNVYYYTSEWYFVLNLSGKSGENLDPKLYEMLSSIEFMN